MAVDTRIESIAGVLPVSMVDWEGKLATVLFLGGCNLRCPYCHNPELVPKKTSFSVSWDHLTELLDEKAGWIDGVVVTGGEPTFSDDLFEVLHRLKSRGLPVKLDTNGTRPGVLKDLFAGSLVDALAMDIKASFEGYDAATRVKGQAPAVQASIDLIAASGIDHEFRTTMVPGFINGEVADIARYLSEKGAARYVLQQFNPGTVLEESTAAINPYPAAYLQDLAENCGGYLPTKVRGAS